MNPIVQKYWDAKLRMRTFRLPAFSELTTPKLAIFDLHLILPPRFRSAGRNFHRNFPRDRKNGRRGSGFHGNVYSAVQKALAGMYGLSGKSMWRLIAGRGRGIEWNFRGNRLRKFFDRFYSEANIDSLVKPSVT